MMKCVLFLESCLFPSKAIKTIGKPSWFPADSFPVSRSQLAPIPSCPFGSKWYPKMDRKWDDSSMFSKHQQ